MKQQETRLGVLIASAIADLQQVIRDQFTLAALELRATGRRLLRSSVAFAAALYLLSVVMLLLVFSAGYALAAAGIATWLSFLIMAGVFTLIAGLLLLYAARAASKAIVPSKALNETQKTIDAFTAAAARIKY